MPFKNRLFLLQTDPGSGGGDGGGGGTGDPDPGGTGGGSPGGENGDPGGTGPDDSQANSELEKARREAAKYRTERNAAQEELKKLKGEGQTEVEKLTTNNTELSTTNATLVETNRLLRVENLAGQAGVAREARKDAAALLPKDAVDDWEDEAAIVKALKAMVKDRPYLAGKTAGGADGGEGGSRETTGDMNALIRAGAGR